MGSLVIVKPIAPTLSTLDRILTPDPKEAINVTGADVTVALDFGAAVTLDSVYIGYHNAAAAQTWALNTANAYNGATAAVAASGTLAPLGLGFPYHTFAQFAPRSSRYWNLVLSRAAGAGFYVGVAAFGAAWSTQWGHEFGSGRLIDDTGSSERLFGGGWANDEGTAATGYQWTFGDLQPLELRQLYQLVRERRTTRPVLVVEDPDQTDGLNERIHWGQFQRLQPYERLDPLNTKWALTIGDWA